MGKIGRGFLKKKQVKKKNWTWVIEENVAWFSVMLK